MRVLALLGVNDQGSPKFVRPTIRDVAKLAGVDPSLVSRVVNNDPRASASAATKRRILDAVQQLGYRANSAARGLKMSRTHTLGLLLPDLGNPMYASMVAGAQTSAEELGYGLILGEHAENHDDSTFRNLLIEGRVDGLLLGSGVLSDKFMRDVADMNLGHVVPINRKITGIKSSVIVRDDLGAEIVVDHFAHLKHRKIFGLFGPMSIDTSKRRLLGFERACSRNQVTGIVIECDGWNAKVGYETTKHLLSESTPTAIFASTFYMAIGVLRAARELGILVPEQLSVVTLHDSELADYLAPPLTTVVMPTERMGAQAVSLLVDLIKGGKGRHIVVQDPPRLMIRSSTAPPPAINSKRMRK